jgi:hypothetical protein
LLSYKLAVRLQETEPNFPPLDHLFSDAALGDFALAARADIASGRF